MLTNGACWVCLADDLGVMADAEFEAYAVQMQASVKVCGSCPWAVSCVVADGIANEVDRCELEQERRRAEYWQAVRVRLDGLFGGAE